MTLPSTSTSTAVRVNVVVPVFNKRQLLERAIGSIVAAADAFGGADIRLVDNGSTDGSLELLRQRFANAATILVLPNATIGAVRNFGAKLGAAEIISFLDCDCLVPSDFFSILLEVFERTGAAAAGRRIVLPPSPTWVEATWDQMHQDGLDGERTWINSANLAVRRDAFERAGGFDEALVTGEDAELCQRILLNGGKIMQDQRLAVAHLDNAKTLGAFYRKERWRGLGMFGTVSSIAVDKPTAMTFLHLGLTCAAAAILVAAPLGWIARAALALALLLTVPALTVLYRKRSSVHRFNVVRAALLYELYFLGRLNALLLIVVRGTLARLRRSPRAA